MEHTAENLGTLQRTLSIGEENRRQANAGLIQLTEKLSTLTDQMRAEQNLLVKLVESQMELRPVLSRLTEAIGGGTFGIDEATREHIRNVDVQLRRLLEELAVNRDLTIGEIRSEIKLLARTIAALAEEAD